jgi:hypothetical protein
MKKNYSLFMLLVLLFANFIHAQFACPELLGTQTTTTTIHFKISAGTCNSYANQIFVSYQGYSATFTKSSCNGVNLKYSSPPGQPLPIADSFSTSFPGGGVCQYINGTLVTLSDNEVSLSDKVLIYPNPVLNGDRLTIKFGSNIAAKLEIYNVTGKLVLSDVVNNDHSKEVNTNALYNGIYMLKISTDEASTTRKFVIMK